MENLLYAFLGWLSGLFSSVLLEWNRDRRHVTSLRKALVFELAQFRYRMANVTYMLTLRSGSLSPDLINWLLDEFENYHGADRNEEMVESFQRVKANPDQLPGVVAAFAANAKQTMLALKKYPTPALEAAIGVLTLFSAKEQQAMLELRTLITNFDAVVDEAWHFSQMTFDSSLTQQSLQKVNANIDIAYRQAAELCQRMSKKAALVVDSI